MMSTSPSKQSPTREEEEVPTILQVNPFSAAAHSSSLPSGGDVQGNTHNNNNVILGFQPSSASDSRGGVTGAPAPKALLGGVGAGNPEEGSLSMPSALMDEILGHHHAMQAQAEGNPLAFGGSNNNNSNNIPTANNNNSNTLDFVPSPSMNNDHLEVASDDESGTSGSRKSGSSRGNKTKKSKSSSSATPTGEGGVGVTNVTATTAIGGATQGEMRNLYVANLPSSVDSGKLRTLFESFGKINDVKLLLDIATGTSRGIGFVMYETPEAAKEAISKMHRFPIDGRLLQVRFAEKAAEKKHEKLVGNVVYVRNIPATVGKEQIRQYFTQFGEVLDVDHHPQSAELRGPSPYNMTFVMFRYNNSAATAVSSVDGKAAFPLPHSNHPFIVAKVVQDIVAEKRKSVILRPRFQQNGAGGQNAGGTGSSPQENPVVGPGSNKQQAPQIMQHRVAGAPMYQANTSASASPLGTSPAPLPAFAGSGTIQRFGALDSSGSAVHSASYSASHSGGSSGKFLTPQQAPLLQHSQVHTVSSGLSQSNSLVSGGFPNSAGSSVNPSGIPFSTTTMTAMNSSSQQQTQQIYRQPDGSMVQVIHHQAPSSMPPNHPTTNVVPGQPGQPPVTTNLVMPGIPQHSTLAAVPQPQQSQLIHQAPGAPTASHGSSLNGYVPQQQQYVVLQQPASPAPSLQQQQFMVQQPTQQTGVAQQPFTQQQTIFAPPTQQQPGVMHVTGAPPPPPGARQ